MNKITPNHLRNAYALLLIFIGLLFFAGNTHAQTKPIFPNTQELVSGVDNQPGAIYLIRDVELASETGSFNADALLTIVSFTGNPVIGNVDNTQFVQNRFEPTITYPTAGDAVRWSFEFIIADSADTNVADAVPFPLDSYTLEIIDLDAQEWAEVFVGTSYELEGAANPGTIITVTPGAQPNSTRFTSSNITDAGVSENNTRSIVRVNYVNTSVVDFTLGRDNTDPSTTRNISIGFLGEVNFSSPAVTNVNTAPTVINQSAMTGFNLASAPINLLNGATDPENNIDPTSIFIVDPNDATNFGEPGRPLVIAGEGTYVVNAAGNVVFTPENNFIGTSTINFRVEDTNNSTSNTASLDVTVADPCDAAASGNVDTDGDNVSNRCDLDDDNDGILDTDEGLVVTSAAPVCGTQPDLNFNNAFVEVTGNNNGVFEEGEVFRFPNVTTNVDALVTIVDLVNITSIPTLDDNSTNPNSFQPQSAFNLANVGDRAYTEYRFDFVQAGTSVPVVIPEFYANFNDVDGNA